MNITLIGSGKVGSTLAQGWLNKGHNVTFGVRDLESFKGKNLSIPAKRIAESTATADVIVISAFPDAIAEIASSLGDVSGKVIIDTMNSMSTKPSSMPNSADALLALTNCRDVVKCFNTMGVENMKDPKYENLGIDMFVAGDSQPGKTIAKKLALDLGFSVVHDLGGNESFELIEQLARCWINLAKRGHGRDFAFHIVKRKGSGN